jgi:hypothetical protein
MAAAHACIFAFDGSERALRRIFSAQRPDGFQSGRAIVMNLSLKNCRASLRQSISSLQKRSLSPFFAEYTAI